MYVFEKKSIEKALPNQLLLGKKRYTNHDELNAIIYIIFLHFYIDINGI